MAKKTTKRAQKKVAAKKADATKREQAAAPKTKIRYDRILVRYGEMALKSDVVRRRMEDRLLGNIRSGLDKMQIKYVLHKEMGRIFVETRQIEETVGVLTHIFGLVSVSPVQTRVIGSSLEKIAETAERIGRTFITSKDTFALRARRTGNENFTSKMIEREAGGRVQDATQARVDLDNPDKTLYVEVRQNKAYFYIEEHACPGGLPLGTQGRVVILFSGSVDAAAAAWLMMKRGCTVVPIYFESSPYTDASTDERAARVFETLREWSHGNKMSLRRVPHGKALFMFTEECRDEHLDVLSKRQMLRVANLIAKQEGARAVVTGDNLNQNASQTLENMAVVDRASELPVFRPVLTWDKEEILKLAQRIGAFEAATKEVKPAPRSRRSFPAVRLEDIEREEQKVDVKKLAEEAAEPVSSKTSS
ncbi:MAG: tRNA 4-thiouridine(8) synthase ThiI [Candidatus Aenigmatarchaeota archaeon]|nr:MAG: tRNA 4-thiouridine(8) synthase ThiI [Candidatus Aenigmarchaeota archaeon]